jgi:inorganic pyrophosphatase
MNLDRVNSGRDVPNDFNVVIEIPMNGDPIKYELDKETGALFVDRFMSTAMPTPATTAIFRTRCPAMAIRSMCWW